MRKRIARGILALFFMIGLLTGCQTGGKNRELVVLTLGTADSGGTMYPVGNAIAEVLSGENRRVNVSASTGSTMNVESLLSGEVDLALISGDVAMSAMKTEDGEALRAVAAVYTSVSNWMAPADSGTIYAHDLRGLRLGIGPASSATELTARQAAEVLGLSGDGTELVNCSLNEGADMVLRGELDAVYGFSGAPIGGLSDLARQIPCKLLLYTPEELETILDSGAPYTAARVPAGTYEGQTQAIDTFGIKCLLCVNASADPELVYAITRDLWDGRELLRQAHPALYALNEGGFLCQELPIPLHEGARRYYEEIGQLSASK